MSASEEKLSYPAEKSAEVGAYANAVDKENGDYDVDSIKVDVNTGLYDGLQVAVALFSCYIPDARLPQRNMKQRHVQMIALAGVIIHLLE